MTFEECLFTKPGDTEEFRALAQNVFGSAHGRLLLSRLCAARHPMKHTESMTPHQHGQAEVVATLWRFGAISAVPPEPTPAPTPQ